MQEIDAREKACPMPVILTKRALKDFPGETVKVRVDNEIAVQNLAKMAEQKEIAFQTEQIASADYMVAFLPNAQEEEKADEAAPEEVKKEKNRKEAYIIVLHADTIGFGPEELGKTLMNSFIFSLTEQEHLPEKILFYNSGAKLTADNSPVLEDLKALENEGVEILTCGICVEYFDFPGGPAVGEATNMYRIAELQAAYKTVSP